MVRIIKYKKIVIAHAIYIKVFSNGTVSYLIFSTGGVLNNTNKESEFTELKRFFKEHIEMKFQEGSILKYLNSRNYQSSLGISVHQTDHIMKIVNECFHNGELEILIHNLGNTLHIQKGTNV